MLDIPSLFTELYKETKHLALLYKKKALCERIRVVWKDAFNCGNVELYTTSLGGTGNVPQNFRFFLQRPDGCKKEITKEQWNYIYNQRS